MAKRRPSMTDVARVAGVNRVTASVALGRSVRGGTRVSDATRQRILDVARAIGYIPNAMALALRGRRTNTVGYYTGNESLDFHEPFTAAILNGLQYSCHRHNQDLIVFGSFQRTSDDALHNALLGGKIDGLILLPTPGGSLIDKLVASHLPIVAIANRLPGVPSVSVDDEAGGRMLAHYLAARGHQRVLYRRNLNDHESTERRREAFVDAAQFLGLQVTITQGDNYGNLEPDEIVLLNRPQHERPTAAACWMDSHAYQMVLHCRDLGIQVPDELAVTGFDGIETAVPAAFRLSTIRAPWENVGATAIELLMQIIDGDPPGNCTLPVELVVGDTA